MEKPVQTDTSALLDRLSYRFQDDGLLLTALTHRSFVEERHPGGNAPLHQAQDRLALLGDACLRSWLIERVLTVHPTALRGPITELLDSYLSEESMAGPAESLRLLEHLRLGRGAAQYQEEARKHRGTTFEAVIGAMVFDGGGDAARSLVVRLVKEGAWQPARPEGDPTKLWNEWYQRRFRCSPPGAVTSTRGPPQAPLFLASLSFEIDGEQLDVEGSGATKKEACRDASRQAIALLRARGEEV